MYPKYPQESRIMGILITKGRSKEKAVLGHESPG